MLPSVFYQELLSNHRCNDCFTKTYYISEEETIIAYQLLITFYYSVRLIIVFSIALGHIKRVRIVSSEHAIREVFHQHFYIQLIRSNITFQVSSIHCILQICCFDGYAFRFLPEQFKLIFCKLDLRILSQFIFRNAQSVATEITASCNSTTKHI